MIGIYLIKNKINQNCYVGLSSNIELRWNNHILRSKNQNSREYNYPLMRALRKYGEKNFDFTILEEIQSYDIDYLNQKEKMWIEKYDSFKNGYNQTSGGDCTTMDKNGEKHWNHSLSQEDVEDIRHRWAACNESVREIYIDYKDKIAKTGFKKIYSWQTWKDILPELNTKENQDWHKNNTIVYSNHGSLNGRAKLTEDDVRIIRTRKKNGEDKLEVYKDYSSLTVGSFTNVWYGYNWKKVIV